MNNKSPVQNTTQTKCLNNASFSPVAQVFYHNFVMSKKNVDGKFLLDNFRIQSTSTNHSQLQNQRRKYYIDEKQKKKFFGSSLSEQKPIKMRSGSSDGSRKIDKPMEFKISLKHLKTSHDTFLFKKSIDLKQRYQFLDNPQNLQKMLKQRKLQSRRGLFEMGVENQEFQSKEKSQKQNFAQCKVLRCNLLAKFLQDPVVIKSKKQPMKRNEKSKGRKFVQTKTSWKKKLDQFIPKQKINQIEELEQSEIIQFPECKAKSYVVLLDRFVIGQKNGNERREIASLTKMMTCMTALYLAEKFEIALESSQVKVSRQAVSLGGTTANLKYGDNLTLKDLLYGMMLPSGNDAAFAIAEYFGRLIYRESPEYTQKIQESIKNQEQNNTNINEVPILANLAEKKINSDKKTSLISSSQAVQYFVQEINLMSQYMEMTKSNFSNCHGLADHRNKSTARDLGKFAVHCMHYSKFREIVGTKTYEAKIFNKNTKMIRIEKWINSNVGLTEQEGLCYGIKTGNTPSAGPCLASYFSSSGHEIIIILLNCESKESRFKFASNIYQSLMKSPWLLKKINEHHQITTGGTKSKQRSKTNF